jgi:hypothetical protein
MSNAFNLSQLANFVDSSGKVNISTGSTGTLPTTQGGTGLTTVGTNGQILQSNGTTLSYVTPASGGVTSLNGQTGDIVNTTLYAIGSYVVGRQAPTTLGTTNAAPNATLAGTSLTNMSVGSVFAFNAENGALNPTLVLAGYGNSYGNASLSAGLVNTGSWRCVSPAGNITTFNAGGQSSPGLWVRYA